VSNPLAFGPFLSLDPENLEHLLAGSRRVTFARGDHLINEGGSGDSVLAVVAGRLRVTQGQPPVVLATPSAPVLVGEAALLTGFARNATVTALTRVRAYRISAQLLRDVMQDEPRFTRELAAFAAVRAGNNFLRRSSPFADLPAASIEALAAKLDPVAFAVGDVVMREGERGDDAYLVRGGELEVIRGAQILATIGPGAFVGEVSALTRMPRTATVRARTDVSAFRLRGDEVRPIVKKHQDLVSRLEGTMQSRHVPRRAGEVVIAPAPDDPTAALLRDAAGSTYLKVTREALAIYEDIDGARTLRDLAMRHFERTGALDPAGVFATVATLQAAGLVTAPRVASDEPDARVLRAMDLVLAPRFEIRDADRIASVLHRFVGGAFSTAGGWIGVTLGVLGLAALITDFRQSSPGDFGLGGLLVAFGGLLLAAIGHEAAHAVATKAEGRRIGKAGIGVFWFTPVVWVDTSDAWLLPARRRIRVNAAGPLFNFAFAGVCGLLGLVLTGRPQDLAIWLAVTNLVSVAFNLSPLLEFDGYYVLEDLANVNALRRKSLHFAFGEFASRPRRPATPRERGFLAYAAAAVAYVVVMSAVVLAGVPALVNGMFGGRLPGELIPIVGVGLALLLAALQVTPLVTEVLAARAAAD
jgi:putative peptide zinc metalloprotease protein